MLEVIIIVSSAILERSLITTYTICRRATYTSDKARNTLKYIFMLKQFGDSKE